MAFVYILKCHNNRYYIGSTDNLERRLTEHRNGLSPYTRHLLPVILVFKQEYTELKIARKVESRLKRLKRRDIIERIINERFIKMDL